MNCLLFLVFVFVRSSMGRTPEKYYNTCILDNIPPSRNSGCCGINSVAVPNIVGGSDTSLRQYPWLALVEYKARGSREVVTQCGAFLISGRYVVTAAHCVYGDILRHTTPVSVRLGEYDKSNPGHDCIEYKDGDEDCNDGAKSVAIEDIIVHEEYNENNIRNDIALLMLRDRVSYTDFIRPICLPESDVTRNPPRDLYLTAAGWGISDHVEGHYGDMEHFASSIKQHVNLPYQDYDVCKRRWGSLFSKTQICAGGEVGKDSCMGDSGGPLMHDNDGIFDAVGIVSFGAGAPCGQRNSYGVYTKVYEYLDWIREHIEY